MALGIHPSDFPGFFFLKEVVKKLMIVYDSYITEARAFPKRLVLEEKTELRELKELLKKRFTVEELLGAVETYLRHPL